MTAETTTLFEIDQPRCTREFGVTCAAHLAATGVRKCFNTRATCQDPANYEQESYFLGTASSSSWASTPDTAIASVTGDIDIRVRCAPADWTPSVTNTLIAKGVWEGSVDAAYAINLLTTGVLRFFRGDGATFDSADSSVSTGFADGSTHWVRATRKLSDGVVTFYTSENGIAWTQLGSTSVLAAADPINDSAGPLVIGNYFNAGAQPTVGKIFYADVRDGIDGVVVAQFDPRRAERTGAATFRSRLGEDWTINAPASVVCGFLRLRFARDQEGMYGYGNVLPMLDEIGTSAAAVNLGGLDRNMAALGRRETITVNLTNAKHSDLLTDPYRLERPTGAAARKLLVLPGSAGNYASTPDTAANSITTDIDIRCKVAPADWTPSTYRVLVAKWDSVSAANRSYVFYLEIPANDGKLGFQTSADGTNPESVSVSSVAVPDVIDGQELWLRVTWDQNNGAGAHEIKFYTSVDYNPGDASGAWTQLGSTITNGSSANGIFDNGQPLRVGAEYGDTYNFAGDIWYAEVRAGIGGAVAARFDPQIAADGAASFAAPGTGETWTVATSGSPAARITAQEMYAPYDSGSFWGKWAARNTYFSSYPCRVREGALGAGLDDLAIREYVLDKFEGPSRGVTITAKDVFSKLEERKAVAPRPSRGELAAAITGSPGSFTLAPSGIGAEYDASGHVCIGSEIIQHTRSGDVMTVVARGALNTEPEDHAQEDLVQQVLSYVNQKAVAIAYDLMANYSELGTFSLPRGKWENATVALTELYTGRIAKPTPVAQLIGELAEQAGLTWYPNTALGEVTLVPLRSAAASVTIDDSTKIIGEPALKRQDARRVSQVWVHYGQKDPTRDLDDADNFHSRVLQLDSDAESPEQYDAAAKRDVFSRWIAQFGRQSAEAVGDRILTMFRNPPWEAKFDLYAAQNRGVLRLADLFFLETGDIQDEIGAPKLATHAVTSIKNDESVITMTSQEVFFATPAAPGAEQEIFIENDAYNLNLRDIYDSQYEAPNGDEVVTFKVLTGVRVGSTSTSAAAIRTGSWPAGVELKIENAGRIQGMSGNGGNGAQGDGPVLNVGSPGAAGGPALQAEVPISVDNADGEIWGGAGGGGGGGVLVTVFFHTTGFGGGGGGGGAGRNLGAPGSGGLTVRHLLGGGTDQGTPGAPGSYGTETAGGAGGATWTPGGAGGGPGLAGAAGTSSSSAGGAGGAGGNYIVGNALVTWLANGDRRGGVA